jgi:hypothetical protein
VKALRSTARARGLGAGCGLKLKARLQYWTAGQLPSGNAAAYIAAEKAAASTLATTKLSSRLQQEQDHDAARAVLRASGAPEALWAI